MNGALLTARREAGQDIGFDFRPLSWREFRILAGILSAKVNTPKRNDLLAAVGRWDDSNRFFKTKTAGLRASDVATFRKTRPPPNLSQLAAKPSPILPPGPAPSRPPT